MEDTPARTTAGGAGAEQFSNTRTLRTMTLPRTLMIAAVSSAALTLFGGCGGDTRRGESERGLTAAENPSTQTSAAPKPSPVAVTRVTDPARRAYIRRVDQVCNSLDPERNAGREQVGASADAQEAAKAYDDDIAVGETELRRVEAIPVPPRERQLIRTNVFEVIRRQLALRRQIRTALAAVDVARLTSLRRELDDLSRSLIGFARGYGFRVCGAD